MIISSAEPLVPIFVFVLHQLKATVIFERISLAQLVLKAKPSRSSLLKYCSLLGKSTWKHLAEVRSVLPCFFMKY